MSVHGLQPPEEAMTKTATETWLDLILEAPDRALQLRAVDALIEEVRRSSRNRAQAIVMESHRKLDSLLP